MNTKTVVILILLFMSNSCIDNKKTNKINSEKNDIKNNSNHKLNDKKDKDFKPFSYPIPNVPKDVILRLTHTDGKGTYQLNWGNNSYKDSANLDELTSNRGSRLPPTFLWSNQQFICLMTNHTGPFSEHLFLPLNKDLSIRFFKDDIEWMDSTENQICYINEDKSDSLNTYWTYEDLINGHKKEFKTPIHKNSCCYPWHNGIEKKDKILEIQLQGDSKNKFKIDIE